MHIPYSTLREGSGGDAVTAIEEGIINSMALATWVDDKTIDVTTINGREGRAIKRQRNKAVGQLQRKIDRCKSGSRCPLGTKSASLTRLNDDVSDHLEPANLFKWRCACSFGVRYRAINCPHPCIIPWPLTDATVASNCHSGREVARNAISTRKLT
ncbi:MAG: hypothetical protein ACYDHP_07210 [Ferrimicrobium sp.]